MNSIGPFWDGNEVWLLTGGGAIFAAFPAVYATTFSAFYMAIMLVIFSLIFRALAIEFRNKIDNVSWYGVWDKAFSGGSILVSILFGVAIGNILTGIPLNSSGDYSAGFFDLITPYTVLIGLTTLAMFIVHGATFLKIKTEGPLRETVSKWLGKSWFFYTALHIISLTTTLIYHQRTFVKLSIVLAVIALISTILIKVSNCKGKVGLPFVFSSISIFSNMFFVASSIFPFMVFNTTSAPSLTIFNSSASQNSLTVMLVMALIGMPIVISYTIFVYRVFSKKWSNS